jgi:chromosome segregation ATPase
MVAQTAGAEMTITLAEQSRCCKDVAQKLAETMSPLASCDEQSHKQEARSTDTGPDLAKINSSSETHIAAFDDALQDIKMLEEQAARLAESLATVKKKVAHLKKMMHERLLDSHRQMEQIKEQARPVESSMSAVFSTTIDQCEVSEGTI